MEEKQIDKVIPESKWTFDKKVTDVFDDMLMRSIPQYDVMRKAVYDLGKRFVLPGTCIVDLGCSRGESLAPFVDRFDAIGDRQRFIGVEVSDPMRQAALKRFESNRNVDVIQVDLRTDYPKEINASLTLIVLTLQFIPIEYRHTLLSKIYESTIHGGAVVLVEKVLGNTGLFDKAMVETYYEMKRQNQYSQEQIERKRLSLEGVLVPITARWNEDLLKQTGFKHVDCFWRWMNFAGWIAVK